MQTSVMVDMQATDPGGLEGDWRDDALCAQVDPELFFPDTGGSPVAAKRVCGRCHVRAECLEYALATCQRWGVWGGMSEQERRKLKRRTG